MHAPYRPRVYSYRTGENDPELLSGFELLQSYLHGVAFAHAPAPQRAVEDSGRYFMPHTIELQDQPGIAVVRVAGAVDLSYWRWVLYDTIWHTRPPAVNRFLVDLRSADLHVELTELSDMGETVRRSVTPGLRVACLCNPPTHGSPIGDSFDSGDFEHVHLFQSEEEAVSWLRSDPHEAAA